MKAKSATVGLYEYAASVGHSVKHIYEQVRLGKIPAQKIDGTWQIKRSVLRAAMKNKSK